MLFLFQLKEYHLGRLKAHFEKNALRKYLAVYFTIQYPKFTKKTFIISVAALFLESLLVYGASFLQGIAFYLALILFFVFSPIIFSLLILFLHSFTVILRNRIISKAKEKRRKLKGLSVIGITGSYGKTSVKEFLYEILKKKFSVVKTKEHKNSEMGISETILRELNEKHEIFICEMAAYSKGGIKLLCDIADPKVGILTNINEQHLSTFGLKENIIETKFELIEYLPENGLAIFNRDSEIINSKIRNLNLKVKAKIFYSTKEESDLYAEDIKVEREWLSFKANSKDGDSASFRVNLLGRHNVENLLAALSCAKNLGMNLKEISERSSFIREEMGGMKIVRRKELNLLDATYSSNPDGVIAHLEYLKTWDGRKAIVMPCLIELGLSASKIHKEIGRKIAEVCDKAIITTSDYFKELKEGALEAGMNDRDIIYLRDANKTLAIVKEFKNRDDIVLLESRVGKSLIDLLKA